MKDKTNHLSPALIDLLSFLQLQHDGTLKNIVDCTQKAWLRQPGKERWEIEEKYPEKQEELLRYFDRLNLIKEIKPQSLHYEYVLFFGATLGSVRLRLKYLIDLWNQGIRFDTLVFLGGQRPLDPNLESREKMLDTSKNNFPYKKDWHPQKPLPQTEIDMIKLVLDQTELPEGFEKVKIVFIDTPMQQTEFGTLRRPNTEDTLSKWLQSNPKPGKCLCISSQPYVDYQDTVLQNVLPPTFTKETVGSQALDNCKTAIYLDTLARWLYQEQKQKCYE